jgi:hypothetical protein
MNTDEMTPQFLAAIRKVTRVKEIYGFGSKEISTAMMLAYEVAPESFKEEMSDMARDMGLMPPADGYLDDGSPVYKLDDVAARFGMDVEEAKEAVDELYFTRSRLSGFQTFENRTILTA